MIIRIAILILISVFFSNFSLNATELRLVSLSPALTEIVCKLNAQNILVGRSSVCDYPLEVKKIPIAGDLGHPNLEKLLSLNPNMVIYDSKYPDLRIDKLARLGIQTVAFPMNKLSDYIHNVRKLGDLLQRQSEATQEIARFNSKLKSVKGGFKALILLDSTPLITCGKKSFLSDLLMYVGAENVADKVDTSYFVISEEFLIKSHIDGIILVGLTSSQRGKLNSIPAWKQLPAVAKNKILIIDRPELICRLSPRLTIGMNLLRSWIKQK